jgi:hypothetical protein
MRTFAGVLAAVLFGCDGSPASPLEGTYTMCRDVSGFSGETIELKGGRFRYWFYSDAGPSHESSGYYQLAGNVLTFEDSTIEARTSAVVNGVPVLWRDDGLSLWQKKGRIQPYAVLIRVEGLTGKPARNQRPSLDRIKSGETQKCEEDDDAKRVEGRPPSCRALLGARSLPDL